MKETCWPSAPSPPDKHQRRCETSNLCLMSYKAELMVWSLIECEQSCFHPPAAPLKCAKKSLAVAMVSKNTHHMVRTRNIRINKAMIRRKQKNMLVLVKKKLFILLSLTMVKMSLTTLHIFIGFYIWRNHKFTMVY